MIIDLDKFKARNPLRDLTFYAALFTTLAMLVPQLERAWRDRAIDAGELGAAVAPLTAWLALHGYVRGKGVEAAGFAAAAAATAPAIEPVADELLDEPEDGFGLVSSGHGHDAVSVTAEQADAGGDA